MIRLTPRYKSTVLFVCVIDFVIRSNHALKHREPNREMKVVVGGGSGLIGRALVASLLADGAEVAVLSRRPSRSSGPGRAIGWEAAGAELEGADAVVNLAGVSLGGPRWTSGRKAVIRASRVDTTRTLARSPRRDSDRRCS